MSHLLAISIGPVQDFIAAARRTADLYAGSQILQEICKAAAESIHSNGGTLIFPSGPSADGANKILAKVSGDPARLVETAKQAAQNKLLALWKETTDKLSPEQKSLIDTQRAQEQLNHFLEFYAAWVPLGDNYPNARKTVERLLAGRKALREFSPTQQFDEGIPKSPLDPSRASIVLDLKPLTDVSPLYLRATEHLDAVSLLKRCYGVLNSGKVVDTRTMARRAARPKAMPDERHGEDDDKLQEPQPYYAILVADGDKMGDLISQKNSPEEHQKLSATLDDFAQKAKKIVAEHHGFLVYSGGDDVLAMLPVNTAIACAKGLSEEFRHAIACAKGLSEEFRHTVRGMLSAGVAIVHYREPLSLSLEAARTAEKAAKNGGRDSLAMALHTRGGAPLTVVRKWDDLRWEELQKAYQAKGVSRGLAYELRELAREWQEEMRIDYLQAEAERILKRKEGKGLKLPELHSIQDLEVFANQLVIARFLSGIEAEMEVQNG
ncbi:MAG: type III-B CRISPR-associated protein Cas10/Cmr2 [Thermaceae bacterium]|nr:type III-B CRISPR-associated protein Cas10/Cmr2 [Thermaceae bacterium]